MNNKVKPRINSFNFIKAICAIGIIVYHISCHLDSKEFLPLYGFANGDWGSVFVTIFFIVSGGLLYYNYSESMDILKYYKKRWRSIFPMFFIVYFFIELLNCILNGSIFYRGNLLPYIYTFLGMDGYLVGSSVETYYIVGEWFLGAIILLYVLFPFVFKIFNKNSVLTSGIYIVLYIVFLDIPIINPYPFRSLTSCLVSFVCGMMLVKYKDKIDKSWLAIISFAVCIIMAFIKLPFSSNVGVHLMGVAAYIVLYVSGQWIMKFSVVCKIFTKLGKLSYAVFLVQHIIIYRVLQLWNPDSVVMIFALSLLIIIVIFMVAKVLYWVEKKIISYFLYIYSKL